MTGPPTGGRIAEGFAALSAKARIAARAATLPAEIDARDRWVTAFMEKLERDLAPTIRKIHAETISDPEAPPQVRAALDAVTQPSHQGDAILGLIALAMGIFNWTGAIAQIEVEDYLNHLRRKLHPYTLPPELAAQAARRGFASKDFARGEALSAGFDTERAEAVYDLASSSPPLSELIIAWRLGHIGDGDFERGLEQLAIRPEWRDAIRKLAHLPPSPSVVMDAAVANQLPLDRARQMWAESGGRAEDFDWVYNTTGPPPPAGDMIDLWRRGDATEAQVMEALLEGPIKNKWIPTVMLTRRRIVPMEQTLAMIRRGVLDPTEAARNLEQLGFAADQVAKMVQWAVDSSIEEGKSIALGQVLTGYRDRFIDRATAEQMTASLGYQADATAFLLGLSDYERDYKRMQMLIARTRSKFLARKIDMAEAGTDLDAFGVPATMRDDLIAEWMVTLDGEVRQLTLAQVTSAVKKQLITPDDAFQRLLAMQYTEDDAAILLALAGVGGEGGT